MYAIFHPTATKSLYVQVLSAADMLARMVRLAQIVYREENSNLDIRLETNVKDIECAATGTSSTLEDHSQIRKFRASVVDRPHVICTRAHIQSRGPSTTSNRSTEHSIEYLALSGMETLMLSPGTVKKRNIIHVVVGVLLAFSGTIACLILFRWVYSQLDLRVMVPFAAASLTFASTLVFYLRWNEQWAREHANAELAAKRDKTDVLRASWVAELLTELAETKTNLPPEALDAFTHGLFRQRGTSKATTHPLDDLTGLVRKGHGLSVGGKGFSLQVGSKPARPPIEPAA